MIYGYARVSTIEQAEGGDSLATQASQVAGYCQMRSWPAPDQMFVEKGVSGSVPFVERPIGMFLMATVAGGDAIIATKLDRMFRNARDALNTMEMLKKRGVSLHLIDLGGDVTGNGISKLVFTILAAVAENERERIAERIREVKDHGRRTGLHIGGPRPFGYDIADGRLVPNETEQSDIEMMRFMRGLHISLQAIGDAVGDMSAMQVKRILERDPARWPAMEVTT